jgi:hypothetical protein
MKRVMLSVGLWAMAACGVVGQPIAPEDVGVAPFIERQKRQQAQQAAAQPQTAEPLQEQEPLPSEPRGQDEDLPPLRPVGTR